MKTRTIPPLMLGSASPRRREILQRLGLEFEVRVRETDETLPPEIVCADAAAWLARKKALAFGDLKEDFLIVTADTVVCLDGESLAKPADAAEAEDMLRSLSGKSHSVITGVGMYHKEILHVFSEETRVHFRKLPPEMIRHYIDTFRPFDKAGAYGIQEWIGMVGIDRIEGDFYNVMGFPAGRFWQELHDGQGLSGPDT